MKQILYQTAICQILVDEELYGTGFLFTDDQSHILTAYHVVEAVAAKLKLDLDDLGARPGAAPLEKAQVCFRVTGDWQKLKHVVTANADEDWAVLALDNRLPTPSLRFGAPRDNAECRAWGFPNALHVGRSIPDNGVLIGRIADVLPDRATFKLLVHSSDNCRGMSGAPVLVDNQWVGIVLAAHLDRDGSLWGKQITACHADRIVRSCDGLLPINGKHHVVEPPKEFPWPPEDDPFPGLKPLSEGHARMLHGRFQVLRKLLDMLLHPSREAPKRLVIVAGRVGVGKSSLLHAGLYPHLKHLKDRETDREIDVRISYRPSSAGMASTLAELAVNTTSKTILILDQVEDCLISKRPSAAKDFAMELARVLDVDAPNAPHRVVLGCRSDYSAELEDCLKAASVFVPEVHVLQPLRREDIIEVLTLGGDEPASRELRQKLNIEASYSADALDRIAGALLEDEDATIAPLLQLRIQKMYEIARRRSNSDLAAPVRYRFEERLYDQVARDLTSIEQHLETQLAPADWPERLRAYSENGLVLDILEHHTTSQATVHSWNLHELQARYCTERAGFAPPCNPEDLQELLQQLQTQRLLVDRERPKEPKDAPRVTAISHDALARVVKQAFQRSTRPGQRCRRLLESRLESANNVKGQVSILNDLDLQFVKDGRAGMRVLTGDEVACVTRSREQSDARHAAERDAREHAEQQRRELEETRRKAAAKEAADARKLEEMELRAAEKKAADAKKIAESAEKIAESAKKNANLFAAVAAATVAAFIIAMVGLGSCVRGGRERKEIAQADTMAERGALEIEDRNFNEAELAFAKSIALRDQPSVRRSLLRARGGTMRLDRRERAPDPQQGFSTISADGVYYAMSPARDRLEVGLAATGERVWCGAFEGKLDNVAIGPQLGHRRLIVLSAIMDNGSYPILVYALHRAAGAGPAAVKLLGKVNVDGAAEGRQAKRIAAIAFDPARARFAAASDDGSLAVYEIAGDAAPARFWFRKEAHTIAAHGVAFTPDGHVLASGGGDYAIKLWRARTDDFREIAELWGHQDSVFGVVFAPDGRQLASGGYDRAIRIWDLARLVPQVVIDALGVFGIEVVETPGDEYKTIRMLQGHRGVVEVLAYSSNGAMLASVSKDETLRLWDVDRARLVTTLKPYLGALRSISFRDFNEPIACGGDHGWASWKSGGRAETKKLWIDGAPILAVAIDPASRMLVAGNNKGALWSWDLETWSPSPVARISEAVNGVAFSPDERWLAAVGEGRKVHVWRRGKHPGDTPAHVHEVGFQGPVWGVAFDPTSTWLSAGAAGKDGAPNEIRLWRIPRGPDQGWGSGHPIATSHAVYSLAATRDLLISGNAAGELQTFSFETGKEVGKPHPNVQAGERNVWGVTTTDDGRVVSANSDGIVRVWDPRRRATIAKSDDPSVNPTLNSVAYNQHRGRIAAGGDGHKIVEYEIVGGRLVAREHFAGQEGTVWMVTYSPDGRWLVYGGLDGFVRVIDLRATDAFMRTDARVLLEQAQATTGAKVREGESGTNDVWVAPIDADERVLSGSCPRS